MQVEEFCPGDPFGTLSHGCADVRAWPGDRIQRRSEKEALMKTIQYLTRANVLWLFACLFALLSGCANHEGGQRHQTGHAQPHPVQMQEDYVYYPGYEVYYASNTRRYVYREGRSWVSRPAPHVSVDVLFASPSVRLDFHDSPASHHTTVSRQYPKHWAPPGWNQAHDQRNQSRPSGNPEEGHR